eukprot:SAG31_NODE_993_length_10512_cov_20.777202_5_plen_177_part_00
MAIGTTDAAVSANQTVEAWKLLGSTVYQSQAGGWHDDTGVEWNALSSPPAVGLNHPWDGSGARGGAFPTAAVYDAWKLLVQSRAADPTTMPTYNYDVVNVGREVRQSNTMPAVCLSQPNHNSVVGKVLAQIITKLENNLTIAVGNGDRQATIAVGAKLMAAYSDLDELLGCVCMWT